MKLHLLLDHDGYLPEYAYISNGNKHDVTIARHLSLSKGSIITMDRAYNDYALFSAWTKKGIYFVTRLKINADYSVIQDFDVPQNRNIISDQLIQFTAQTAQKQCPQPMRKVVVWDKVNQQQIVLLTNHLDFGATTISAIYKDRWQIEPESENICRDQRKCSLYTDLDSIDRHFVGQVSSVQGQIRLVPVEPGGLFTLEPFYIQELMGLDRQAF